MSAGFVLVLGGANMDVSACADHALRPGDSTPGRVRSSPGGVARNVAENLARLGHDARLISAVGNDAQGHALLNATRQAGVDVSGCRVLPGVATASYVSVHGVDGDMAVAVNDMQALEHITPASLELHARLVGQAAALVVDCNPSESALAWLFAHCGSTPVFVDAVSAFKCRRLLPWLDQVHTLKVNRLEAQALSGLAVSSLHEVEQAACWLHRQGVQHVVVSLGEQGLYYSANEGGEAAGTDAGARADPREHESEHESERGWQAALPTTVLNATGAGDALMAGLVHSFLVDLVQTDSRRVNLHPSPGPLARAVRFASGCAALTLTAESANHPSLCVDLVEQWLQALPATGAARPLDDHLREHLPPPTP